MRSEDFSWGARLGGGSFGSVYKVTRFADNQRYVAKEVRLDTPERRDAAMSEVRILEQIDHPRIVRLIGSYIEECETDSALLVIVMELCDAGDVHGMLAARRGRLLDEEEVWRYFLQAALGLRHLHELRIIHRDIKSQNFFLTSAGGLKIGDFGLSRLLGSRHTHAISVEASPVNDGGTGRWASSWFSARYSGPKNQYRPQTYSRQPITWRMKPSTLLIGARPSRYATSAARTTSIGSSRPMFIALLSTLWASFHSAASMASSWAPKPGSPSSTKRCSRSSACARVTGQRPSVAAPQSAI